MNLNEYQALASTTAIYPQHLKMLYPALGLGGECAEYVHKLFEDIPRNERTKELGDILWYTAAVATDCGLSLSECAEVDSFEDLPGFPGEEFINTRLIIVCGPIYENIKKAFRDDNGTLSDSRRELIRRAISDILNILTEHAVELMTTLDKVAVENYAKLKSRQERDMLQGSGDNR